MEREKATEKQDLPHQYLNCEGVCRVCHTHVMDPRHMAWEKANAQESQRSLFERELGT